MAKDFPANPTNGQYFDGFVYSTTKTRWDSAYAPRPATIPISTANGIINGAFDIWQRGTSFNGTSGAYTADRWVYYTNASGATTTISRQSFAPGDSLALGAEYYLRFARTVAGTSESYSNFAQWVEGVGAYAGKTTTVSFWAKADAVRSLPVIVEQNFGTGGSGTVQATMGTVSLTTSWQRYSVTAVVPSISGKTVGANNKVGFLVQFPFNTAQTIDLFGFQVEEGAAATDFRRNAPSIQAELAACQRYYYRATARGANAPFAVGQQQTTTTSRYQFSLPVPMRATPAALDYSGPFQENSLSLADSMYTFSTMSIESNWYSDKIVYLIVSNTGGTAGRVLNLSAYNSTNAYIGISSEL